MKIHSRAVIEFKLFILPIFLVGLFFLGINNALAANLQLTATPPVATIPGLITISWNLAGVPDRVGSIVYDYSCRDSSGSFHAGRTGSVRIASWPVSTYGVTCFQYGYDSAAVCEPENPNCGIIQPTPIASQSVSIGFTPPAGPAGSCLLSREIIEYTDDMCPGQCIANVGLSMLILPGRQIRWLQDQLPSCSGPCGGTTITYGSVANTPLCIGSSISMIPNVSLTAVPGTCGTQSVTLNWADPRYGQSEVDIQYHGRLNAGPVVFIGTNINTINLNSLGHNLSHSVEIRPTLVPIANPGSPTVGEWRPLSITSPQACDCQATTIDRCYLPATDHSQARGTCTINSIGACNYTCNNGNWIRNSNTCAAPQPPSVNLNFIPTNTGGAGGQQNPGSPNRPDEALR